MAPRRSESRNWRHRKDKISRQASLGVESLDNCDSEASDWIEENSEGRKDGGKEESNKEGLKIRTQCSPRLTVLNPVNHGDISAIDSWI